MIFNLLFPNNLSEKVCNQNQVKKLYQFLNQEGSWVICYMLNGAFGFQVTRLLWGSNPEFLESLMLARAKTYIKRNQNEIHYRNRHQTKYSLITNDKMTEKQNARQNLKHMRLTCTNTNPLAHQIIHHHPPSPSLPPPHPVGTHKWSNPWGLPEGLQTCFVMHWIGLSTGSSNFHQSNKSQILFKE